MPTPVPTMTDTPDFPSLADRAAGTYNSKAYAFGTHMADTFNDEVIAVAQSAYENAVEAGDAASTATTKAGEATSAASTANSAAQTAVNAPGSQATSATSLAIPTTLPSSKPLTLAQTGKAFAVGQTVKLTSQANPGNWMLGDITAFAPDTGAMTVNVSYTYGSGTFTDWAVTLSAPVMTTTENAVVSKSANYTMLASDRGQVVQATSALTLSYDPAATLGNGWYHYLLNDSGVSVTINPSGSELVDGVATVDIPSGWMVLILSTGTGLRTAGLPTVAQLHSLASSF